MREEEEKVEEVKRRNAAIENEISCFQDKQKTLEKSVELRTNDLERLNSRIHETRSHISIEEEKAMKEIEAIEQEKSKIEERINYLSLEIDRIQELIWIKVKIFDFIVKELQIEKNME